MRYLLLLLLLSRFSCVRLCATPDSSPPGFPVPGILQAKTLEWVAISFSNAWKWNVKGKALSRIWLLVSPWTTVYQAPPSTGFSRQDYWSGLALPSPKYEVPRVIKFMETETVVMIREGKIGNYCLMVHRKWWLLYNKENVINAIYLHT